MKEKIVLIPGGNVPELMMTLARLGKGTLGWRFMSPADLAGLISDRIPSAAAGDRLPADQARRVLYRIIKKIPYFEYASLEDAGRVYEAICTMRSFVEDPAREREEIKDKLLAAPEFPRKNEALYDAFIKYLDWCRAKGRFDEIDLVRAAALAETGAADAAATAGNASAALAQLRQDSDFIVLREFPLTPLEKRLLDTASGGSYDVRSLADLIPDGLPAPQEPTFTAAYGHTNEVEDIISTICREGLTFDECTVACADADTYSRLLQEMADRYGVPVAFGEGVAISDSNPAKLLNLLHEWNTTGYNGVDALSRLMHASCVDREKLLTDIGFAGGKPEPGELNTLIKAAGNLRLSFNSGNNADRIDAAVKAGKLVEPALVPAGAKYKPADPAKVRALADALQKGYAQFINDYAYVRRDKARARLLDRQARETIVSALQGYRDIGGREEEIIPELLNLRVNCEASRHGAIYITSVRGAMCALRRQIFVCGLSSADYPGLPSEDPLLSDNDLQAFACAGAPDFVRPVPDSREEIDARKEDFRNLLALAQKAGSRVRLSYPDFSQEELKPRNPSSVMYEYYAEKNPGATAAMFKDACRKAGYFSSGLAPERRLVKAYSDGSQYTAPWKVGEHPIDPQQFAGKEWSPTALEKYFECPQHFYLTCVCGLKEDDPDEPFDVIDAKDTGSLVHEMMKELGASRLTRSDFLKESEEAFDRFLAGRPAMHEDAADSERREFLEIMGKAFDGDPGNTVVLAEEDISGVHPCGLELAGTIDRLEKNPDGTYTVVDFKTGRTLKHEEDDVKSCLQACVYAWICKKDGYNVTCCEYRYLRLGEVVRCKFDAETESVLAGLLGQVADALNTGTFDANPSEDTCRYCRHKDICKDKYEEKWRN